MFAAIKRFSLLAILTLMATVVYAQTAPPAGMEGQSLRSWLKANYFDANHNTLGYTTARMYMYNYIDNQSNKIRGVYSGYEVSWAYGGTGTNPAPINCEHTVPQSFFGQGEPMKSDIHHLFPTYQNWNSTRSNHPFAEIDDNTTAKWMYLTTGQTAIPTSNIDAYSEYANSQFEPREDHKGNVARAVFYFYTMYPTQAGDISRVGNINTLYQWHLNDPVDGNEIARNNMIEAYQGDRNPYIDYPEAVAAAWGFNAPSNTPPSAPASFALQASTSALSLSWFDVSNEDGYYIYKSVDNTTFSQVASLTANTTSYTDNNVVAGDTHYYYAVAHNTYGNSPNSATANGTLQTGGNTGGSGGADLLISEYVEGSSYNKVIEIANFTGADINLASYALGKQSNGAGDWSTLALAGSLANGEVYVIAHTSADASINANLRTGSAAMTFNGNDAVALLKGGVVIDVVGDFNSAATFGQDVTLARNANVTAPNTSYTTAEWTSLPSNTFSNLGSHTMDGGTAPEPCNQAAGLTASNVTDNSASLSWTAGAGATSYEVRYRATGTATWTTTATSATTANISGLSEVITYEFQVATVCASATSEFTASSAFTTTAAPCDQAAGLVYSNVSETTATLAWSAAANAVSYELRYRQSGTSTWTSNILTGTSANITGLTEGTTYEFQVATTCANSTSAFTTSANFTTNSAPVATGDPLFISEYVEGSSFNKAIEIANTTGASVNLSGYTLRRQANGAGAWGADYALSGTLADGEAFVVAHSSADAAVLAVADITTAAEAMTFNGNDPVGLFYNGVLLDVVGIFNGGTTNFAQDITLQRNVSAPNTSYVAGEWTSTATDDFSGLGFITGGNTAPVTDILAYDNFEGGWGNWTDGGSDCSLYSGSYAYAGSYAANIQDNSGVASSFYLTNGLDVTAYSQLTVDFAFYSRSMENNEDFWLQYFDGSRWITVVSYAQGRDFSNDGFYTASVNLDAGAYSFPSNASFRFMCDASGNADDIYVDEITITGTTGGATARKSSGNIQFMREGVAGIEEEAEALDIDFTIYPNPAQGGNEITLKVNEMESNLRVAIYNINGALMMNQDVADYNTKISLNNLPSGFYMVSLITDDGIQTKRLIVR